MRGQPVDIEQIDEADARTLRLRGELDVAGVPALERRVRATCEDDTGSLTIDLSGLTFVDSSGIAALVLADTLCERHQLEFSLVRGPAQVQRLFILTGLNDVLPFRDSADG